jgi:GNAT superfamily N-acetyltransferase
VIEVAIADPESPDGQRLLAALSEALLRITGSSGTASFQVSDVQLEGACFAIARQSGGQPVGCGAIRPLEPGVAELKRMVAAPGSKGVGSAILAFLERQASELGYGQIWLETRKVNQRAVSFYERHGYRPIANFGRYTGRPEAVCLGKLLPSVQALAAEPQQPANPSVKGTSCGKPQAAPYVERYASGARDAKC